MINIVGIDLGTTFSALARLNTIGRPEIVPNADGDRLTPSAVFFDESQTDMVRVGVEAVNSRHIDAQRSARWIKRHIGQDDFEMEVDGKKYDAVQLSAFVLSKLKDDCTQEHGAVKDAVISVPAHFDELRRKATMQAGTAAGLNVIGILNEPVAAALYYATTRDVAGKVLVYDLGGGTFDVTILNVKGRKMDIICSQGDHALGGVDFDAAIVKMLEDIYQKEHNCPLIDSEETRAKITDEAEDIKKTLSRRPTAKKVLYGPAGSVRVEISREMFEQQIAALISRTEMLIEVAMDEANLTINDIDKVLLVGGSTRIPVVRQKLTNMFGFEPESTVNVDECVAMGAAIHAGLVTLEKDKTKLPEPIAAGLGDIKLTDVCNHSYGTICAPLDKQTGRRIVSNKIILRKNTPIPCNQTQTFYTVSKGQKHVELTITQGEDDDPQFINRIATYRLDLPPDRPAKCPIEVTYSYDRNQRMHCTFKDLISGRQLQVELAIDQNDQPKQLNTCQQKQTPQPANAD